MSLCSHLGLFERCWTDFTVEIKVRRTTASGLPHSNVWCKQIWCLKCFAEVPSFFRILRHHEFSVFQLWPVCMTNGERLCKINKREHLPLTGHVYRAGDEAILPELPGLSDIYYCSLACSQEPLQLLVGHICTRRRWAETAQQHCADRICQVNTLHESCASMTDRGVVFEWAEQHAASVLKHNYPSKLTCAAGVGADEAGQRVS